MHSPKSANTTRISELYELSQVEALGNSDLNLSKILSAFQKELEQLLYLLSNHNAQRYSNAIII